MCGGTGTGTIDIGKVRNVQQGTQIPSVGGSSGTGPNVYRALITDAAHGRCRVHMRGPGLHWSSQACRCTERRWKPGACPIGEPGGVSSAAGGMVVSHVRFSRVRFSRVRFRKRAMAPCCAVRDWGEAGVHLLPRLWH